MEDIFPDYEPPAQICHYRRLLTDEDAGIAEAAILRDELNFRRPLSFNDPFDCRPYLYIGDPDALARKISKRRQIPYDASHTVNEDGIDQGWDALLRKTVMCCFSANDNNPIMWAHYAGNHKGICLVYEPYWEDQKYYTFPVSYTEERPKIDFCRLHELETVKQGLCTKSLYWKNEEEHRMFFLNEEEGFHKIPSTMLQAVIMGRDISERNKDWITKIVHQRGGVKLFQAEFCKKTYDIIKSPEL